ncbi:MAG TPA: hypothetical protein VN380_09495 [Thermoanaerobaculia bacterium]|jgi:hypothetical protein|nr:hypothetical protein [Thermoanaerobaculia bacterium]
MRKVVLLLSIALVIAVVIPSAHAGTSTLTLKRGPVINVADAAGYWQYMAGSVFRGNTQVGGFAATLRFINGETPTASMFTLSLFFSGANPPRNVTLMGSWTSSPGGGIGGVSAASVPYQFLQHDGTFVMTSTSATTFTLTINWTGGGVVP